MPLTDENLLQFFRRKEGGFITQRDIALSEDTWSLQPLLYYLANGIQAKTIIEIGVADGSTTMPLLKAASENGGMVHSIDPSDCWDCRRLVSATGCESFFTFYNMKSDEFFARNYIEKIDFAFIDGDHEYPFVERDVRNCCKRLSEVGLIIVSDFDMGSTCNALSPERWDPEIYTKAQPLPNFTVSEQGQQNGIFKGVNLVMHEFPDLAAICLGDRSNASMIIGRLFNKMIRR